MDYNYSDVHSFQTKNLVYPETTFQKDKIFRIKPESFRVEITDDAVKFLEKNSELKMPLIYIESVVANYFKSSRLILEYVDEDCLLMSVVLKDTPENALKKLWQFDADWWLEHTYLAKEKLCIDVIAV